MKLIQNAFVSLCKLGTRIAAARVLMAALFMLSVGFALALPAGQAHAEVSCSQEVRGDAIPPNGSHTIYFHEADGICSLDSNGAGMNLYFEHDRAILANWSLPSSYSGGTGCYTEGVTFFTDPGYTCTAIFNYNDSNDNPITVKAIMSNVDGTLTINSVTLSGGRFGDIAPPPLPVPSITSIDPSFGPLGGGTTVTVNGQNLMGVTVKFGSQQGTNVLVNQTGTSLTVTAPAGLAAGTPVSVVANPPMGDSGSNDNFKYTYVAPPVVTALDNFPKMTAGTPVEFPLVSVSGGIGNITLNAPELPQGLTLTYDVNKQQGIVSGTPASGVSTVLHVTATDGATPPQTSEQVNIDFKVNDVALMPQTVNFSSSAPTGAKVGGSSSVSAQSNSEYNSVVLSIDQASVNVCHLDAQSSTSSSASATVNYDAVGTCKILADQGEGNGYAAASQAVLSFDIAAASAAPAAPTVTASFTPSSVAVNETTSLKIQVKNTATVNEIVTLAPSSLPAGLAIVQAGMGSSCYAENGWITNTQVSPPTVAFGRLHVDAGATCTVTFPLTATAAAGPSTMTLGAINWGIESDLGALPNMLSTVTSDSVTVTAPVANTAPVADAGPDQTNVASGTTVTLDGSKSSDLDKDPLTYSWVQKEDGTTRVTLVNADGAAPSFTAPTLSSSDPDTVLTFVLTVGDGHTTSDASVTITVKPPAKPASTLMMSINLPSPGTGDLIVMTATLTNQRAALESHSPFMFAATSPLMNLMQLASQTPTPTVTFKDNGAAIPVCVDVPLVNNVATCSVTATPGSHSYSAEYNDGQLSIVESSNTLTVNVTKPGLEMTAVGSFLSDRANQLVTNMFDMSRGADRLNEAQGNAKSSSSNFSDDDASAPKSDLLPLAFTRNTVNHGGTLIPALGVASSSGMQDFWGLQTMLQNAMRNAGQSGSMDRFNYSGAFDATVDAHEGLAASFHTSLSQIMKFNDKLQAQEAGAAGFGHSASSYSPLDIWLEGTYAGYSGTRSGQFGLFSVGTDYVLNPNLLIGAFSQIDSMDQTSGTGVSGLGWLAGPYMTARLQQNLFFNARAGFGMSGNTLDGSGSFGSTRWLASASLSGKWQLADSLNLSPDLSFTYFTDTSAAYTDQFGVTIPSVKTELGQLKLSPTLSYGFATDGGSWIEPSIAPELIWNFAATNVDGIGALSDTATGPKGLRGRVKAGITFRTPSGMSISASGNYDGIGSTGYSSVGAQAQVNVPLN